MDHSRSVWHWIALHRWLTLAATALLLLPACDGRQRPTTPPDTATTTTPTVCDLLSQDDLRGVTRLDFKPGVRRGASLCRFESEAENAMGLSAQRLSLRLNRYGKPVEAAVASYSDMRRQALGEAINDYVVQAVEGVGDHALWERYSGIRQLAVFKADATGRTLVVVIGPEGFSNDRHARRIAVHLARRVLVRLQAMPDFPA